MSKTSYFLLTVIVAALLYMGAVRGYQFYEQKAAQWEDERAGEGGVFSFQQVPVSLAAPQAEPTASPVEFLPQRSAAVFLEDTLLAEQEQTQQAHDTIRSILRDYKNDPALQSFNSDLKKATQGQAADLGALSGENLAQVLKENPQISEVVSKHMKDPDFAQVVQQIFSNPQFVESIRHLQQPGAAAHKKTQQ
ncbi:MAG: hypothetical protein MJ053_05055 [Elusimicrobiaceae bacterium]|nr:hypothetical protein [Elusimicrobiaceae bacterium]